VEAALSGHAKISSEPQFEAVAGIIRGRREVIAQIRSAVQGIAWPAIPGQEAALALALQFQLARSERLDPRRLLELQLRQLDALVRHAYRTVPFYREAWRGLYDPDRPLDLEGFARLPRLARSALQSHFEALKSEAPPAAHGPLFEGRTSGSTGTPVRILKTVLVELWWRAFTLREHLWHGRDFTGTLAAIRHGTGEQRGTGWGPATSPVVEDGPVATLPIAADVDAQLDWLVRVAPDYLLTYPSNAAALAQRALERGVRLARLREVRTMGETLEPETREQVRRAWDVPVTDTYSAEEVGYIALQCPHREHYHVQAEGVVVEILDEAGKPCAAGQAGRVVVTPLHNFALPLVRYEIGDYAEAGAPCPCGRGLPVIRRILGRVRNMLVTADGRRFWPHFGSRTLAQIAPVLQHQFVQTRVDEIEARLVTARPLTAAEEQALHRHLLARLPAGFAVRLRSVEAIARGPGGKFEDFVCEIAASGEGR
jgi:phenylacetate-CoA ligase